MNKIYCFLPCYNEGSNINSLLDEWVAQKNRLKLEKYELLISVIDDCSTDNTANVVSEYQILHKDVLLIKHEVNKGLSGGLNTAITEFLRRADESDYMVLMDGDNTHNPRYIHKMLVEIKKGYDVVIASRYCSDSGIRGLKFNREIMSKFARAYYKLILRIPNVKDYTCGYRLYNYSSIKRLLDEYGIEPIKEKSFACMMEFLYKLHLTGSVFSEIGFVLEYDNKKGDSKMKVISTARNSIITAIRLVRNKGDSK